MILSLLIPLLLCLSSTSHAGRYYIDHRTCEDPALIETSMQNAFRLAQSALNAVQASPLDPQTEQNAKWMFDTATWARKQNAVQAVFGGGNLFGDSTDGVLSMNNRIRGHTTFFDLGGDDVMIYCGTDRFSSADNGKGDGIDDDLELRNILQEKAIVPKNVYRACGIFAFISFDTIAFTYTHGETEEEIDNTPGQITICPWYIRMLKLKSTLNKWIDTVDIINALAPRLQGSWLERNTVKLTMRYFQNTLDNTLLHEMTHLKAAGVLEDVRGNFRSYGWLHCRTMSVDYNDGDRGELGPFNNADTYSYFAIASKLNQAGLKVLDKGEIAKI